MSEDPLAYVRRCLSNLDQVRGTCWNPAADVYRIQDGWVVKVDLAGVAPEDVQITVRGRRLVVAGIRRDVTVREGLHPYSMEIAYSRFERAIDLPVDLAEFDIALESREGMLLVTFERRSWRR
jgi:HSP20 family protein